MSDTPAPCEMVHTPPFDFASCTTHDTTFPLGSQCEWYGVTSVTEHLMAKIDDLRARAVRAEHERDTLLIERAGAGPWNDRHGDVWRADEDGLLHSPETRSLPRELVERKCGPLISFERDAEYARIAEDAALQILDVAQHLSFTSAHTSDEAVKPSNHRFAEHLNTAITKLLDE